MNERAILLVIDRRGSALDWHARRMASLLAERKIEIVEIGRLSELDLTDFSVIYIYCGELFDPEAVPIPYRKLGLHFSTQKGIRRFTAAYGWRERYRPESRVAGTVTAFSKPHFDLLSSNWGRARRVRLGIDSEVFNPSGRSSARRLRFACLGEGFDPIRSEILSAARLCGGMEEIDPAASPVERARDYRQVDVLIVSGEGPDAALATLEAMASGVFVVHYSDVAGDDYLLNAVNGLFVHPRVDFLEEAIRWCLAKPDVVIDGGSAAAVWAKKDASWKAAGEHFDAVLSECVKVANGWPRSLSR